LKRGLSRSKVCRRREE